MVTREPITSLKKSRSARDLLQKLTSTPSQSKKSLEQTEHQLTRPPKLDLALELNKQYAPWPEPFTVLTPKDDEFQNKDLMTPIRQMIATPETSQPPQQQSLRTHSEQRAKVLSTIIDFENESIVEMYTPRKPVYIQNSIRLDSACGILESLSLGDHQDGCDIEPQADEEKEGACFNNYSTDTDADDLTFDGVFSTSTSCQNSPSKDPFDTVSLTETNIQIYKRTHRKSKHSSLHFVQDNFDSPTEPQRKLQTPQLQPQPLPQTLDAASPPQPLQAGLVENQRDSKNADLYQLEIMLLQEKHKYEMKQQQRAMKHLQLQLKQQRTENTMLRNKLSQLEFNEGELLPAFKWNKSVIKNVTRKSPKVTFKDDQGNDDAGSMLSTEESIMSLYYDERKVSGASTVGSSTNSVNKDYD